MAFYNSYFPQYQQPMPAQISSDVKWVQGESGAKSYLVAPNTEVTLWDTESKTIYRKSADAYGMPKISIYEYKEKVVEPPKLPISEGYSKEEWDRLKSDVNSLRNTVETIRKEMMSNEHGTDHDAVSAV